MADTQSTPQENQPAPKADAPAQPKATAVPSAVVNTYFFPDLQISVEAESLAAAIELVNKKDK